MLSRRHVLQSMSSGFGYLAFAGIASKSDAADRRESAGPLSVRPTHFAPRAKRVLFLCMSGGPSHVDSFDYKPELQRNDGRAMFYPGARTSHGKLMASRWKFRQRGESGLWVSDLFPKIAEQADRLCLLRGMNTNVPAHPQAFLEMHTGTSQFVRPSVGAWTIYGLGTENENLPGFISLNPPSGNGGGQNYGSSFLPAAYQGTPIKIQRGVAKFPNIANPLIDPPTQRRQLDFVQSLNQSHLTAGGDDREVEGVLESYELAFRMQDTVPEVMSIDDETQATQTRYGLDRDETAGFGRQCLMARRFLEAGVRFVEVSHDGWDQHANLTTDHAMHAEAVDQPIAELLNDLDERGLLDDTLVLFGGEFGRTPVVQGVDGRDHNHKGYTMWMAGGGVKSGFSYGQTDEFGQEAIEGKMHTHDLHATILHLLGLDHERLTYSYAGRDFRLTDIHGRVAEAILA
ncbi:DUF1501 domain-containing protein [Neorhodopirellula pilleata]|uniref:Sulfatase n=1 Tax=Neorhodopirellula pilleata TaxID=2714738 RepID=A0A5C6AT22_9BACT|nr:DUF1501 domain-containing protein [Neorhodopirellula pilleata]TWU03203.1 hypothetical protein Pla100_01210 [Neorhodopirellula pilleata]